MKLEECNEGEKEESKDDTGEEKRIALSGPDRQTENGPGKVLQMMSMVDIDICGCFCFDGPEWKHLKVLQNVW